MKIGFTGTQNEPTFEQKSTLANILRWFNENKSVTECHHGDCKGSDAQFHIECLSLKMPIVVHPPVNSYKRAYCEGYAEIRGVKEYLDRNHDIVDEVDMLIATPKEYNEQLRSGTWATVRYAEKKGKTIIFIYPDGTMKAKKSS